MSSAGLVEQVTSPQGWSKTTIHGGISIKQSLRDMNRTRRIRRMRRVVIASAESSREFLGGRGRDCETLLVTLTYAPTAKWDARQIADYIRSVSDWARSRKLRLRYQWVIELTQRGVPHYHVLWWVPVGVRLPKPDSSGMWPFGFSRIEKARNAVGYLVKYATKGETDLYQLPKGSRLFGVGGGLQSEKLATHRAGLPMWLLDRLPDDARARKVARVGWVDLSTGEVHQTPFEVVWWRDDWGVVSITISRKEDAV